LSESDEGCVCRDPGVRMTTEGQAESSEIKGNARFGGMEGEITGELRR